MIDVRRLAVLRELHRCGTVTAAAAALHLTPSAVSQQLAALGRQTGTALVEQSGRRLALTGAGLVLVQHAEAVLAELELAETALRAFAAGQSGVVTVGAFPTAINGLVIPAMRRLRAEAPQVRVQVRDLTGDDGVDATMSGEVDVALWLAYPGSRTVEERGAVGVPLLEDVLDLVLRADQPQESAGVVIRPVAGPLPRRSLKLITRPAAATAPHVAAVVDRITAAAAEVDGPIAA